MKLFFTKSVVVLGALLALVFVVNANPSETEQQIISFRMLEQPLRWVGMTNPSAAETLALAKAVENCEREKQGFRPLEQFLIEYPGSPWAPSLHANLGLACRKAGAYSQALAHWDRAWTMLATHTNGAGKAVGDFALANWLQLLSSLGRVDSLTNVLQQTHGRVFEKIEWQTIYNKVDANARIMQLNPGGSFKCGTLALAELARAFGAPESTVGNLQDVPSPATGFTMLDLTRLAQQYALNVVGMQRTSGTDIVVPSVVHWKERHYAAIVARSGDRYRVIDPTFGSPRWLPVDVINAEASGYFLVATTNMLSTWRKIDTEQLAVIFGKGIDDSVRPAPPPCIAEEPICCRDSGGAGPGGSGGSPGCSRCFRAHSHSHDSSLGMPTWHVSEPYLATWLYDTPFTYKTSFGTDMNLTVTYHSDEERPDDTSVFNFGPYWNCNWLSYMQVSDEYWYPGDTLDPFLKRWYAYVFGTGGGQRFYINGSTEHEHTSSTTATIVTNSTEATAMKIHYPDGAVWTYGLKTPHPTSDGWKRFFITSKTDAQGRTTMFNYTTNGWVIYLNTVVDMDGRTNTLNYNTNAAVPTQVTSIESPYGHVARFGYNANRFLTNCVDAMQMTNAFAYLLTNGLYILTNATTPYGSTGFEYYKPHGVIYGAGGFNRGVTVREANGAKHLFAFHDDQGPYLPCSYDDNPPGIGQCTCNYAIQTLGINNQNMQYRNSWYWGPRTSGLLSTTNLDLMTTNDFKLARLRNWFKGAGLTDTISMQRDPSPDGVTEGQKTWHGFVVNGVNRCRAEGTNNLPNYIAQTLPNGETWYNFKTYDQWGHTLLDVTTWSNGGTVDTRTNRFEYSTDGLDLLRVYDASGHLVQSNLYNSLHQVIASRNAVGEWTTNTYDSAGRLTSARTPAGLTTTNRYDANGFLTNTVDLEISRTNSFTYTNGLVYIRTDDRGLATTNRWDAFQRLISTTYPDGSYISNRYEKLDLAATRDRVGNWSYFAYDSVRNRTAVTNALTNVTTYAYCNCGALDSFTDALTNTTSFYYDYAGRQIATVYPDNTWFTNVFDAKSRIIRTFDSAGSSITNTYNHQGLIVAVSNSFGLVRSKTYDIDDHMTNSVDASGVSIGFIYDDLGRVIRRTYPDTGTERFGYNAFGLVAVTNQNTNVTRFGYDAAGRKTRETNANNEVVQFAYNAAGDLTSLTDGKNQVTQWKYDEYGRVTNKTDAASTIIFTYRYDANGRLTNRWTPAKGNTFYTYDAGGNLKKVDYTNSTDLTFTYDKLNRLINTVDAAGTTVYAYNSVGLVTLDDGPWDNDNVSFSYANKLRSAMTVEGTHGFPSSAFAYTYDSIKRLDTVSSPAGTFDYTYHSGPTPLLARLSLPNTAYITNAYDSVARLSDTWLKNSSGTVLDSSSYHRTNGSPRIIQTTRPDGNKVLYEYDPTDQLKVARGQESGGAQRIHERFGYKYDAAGNLENKTNYNLVQSFALNNLNQITNYSRGSSLAVAGMVWGSPTNVQVNGNNAALYGDETFAHELTYADGTNSYNVQAFDAAGRTAEDSVTVNHPASLTFKYDQNGNLLTDGIRHFTYDDENQLTQVVVTNRTKSEFTYDAKLRRRIRKESVWAGGAWQFIQEVHYIYDGLLVVQERHFDPKLSATVPLSLVTYTRGTDLSGARQGAGGIGGLLARSELIIAETTSTYFHSDTAGNVTALIDTNQNVVASYLYEPFGTVIASAGPMANENLYRFSSKEAHDQSGLLYYLYRYYLPDLQRWVSRDPIREQGGINLYRFVRNGAPNVIDPVGLLVVAPAPGAIAAVCGAGVGAGTVTTSAGGAGTVIVVVGGGGAVVSTLGAACMGISGTVPVVVIWSLMQGVQDPSCLYPDPQRTGICNPVPSVVRCPLIPRQGDYLTDSNECYRRAREAYEESKRQGYPITENDVDRIWWDCMREKGHSPNHPRPTEP